MKSPYRHNCQTNLVIFFHELSVLSDVYANVIKMGQPRPLIIYFRSFETNIITILQQIYVKKCPSNIWCWDSNPRPLEHESPPITTRPGLLHIYAIVNSLPLGLSLPLTRHNLHFWIAASEAATNFETCQSHFKMSPWSYAFHKHTSLPFGPIWAFTKELHVPALPTYLLLRGFSFPNLGQDSFFTIFSYSVSLSFPLSLSSQPG